MPSVLALARLLVLLAVALVAAAPAGAQDLPPEAGVVQDTVETEGLTGGEVEGEAVEVVPHAEEPPPPLFLVLPFAVLLLMIATGPLFYPHHWHHHYPRYALGLGLLVGAYYAVVLGTGTPIVHALEEYLSFIALLASLFIASGGILIRTDLAGTPRANAGLLFVGAVISNVIGTTGASMLLIRPFMRLNRGRLKAYHIVFFIFIVSNVGGGLTPIGDPPLFLGFLRGVPFFWTLTHVWYIWLPCIAILLGIFYVIDSRNKAESVREEIEDAGGDPIPGEASDVRPVPTRAHIHITGAKNFLWLAVVIVSVFLDPKVLPFVPDLRSLVHVGAYHLPFGIREVIMFAVCFFAYRFANREALRGNDFTFEPIREVAWLFIGIFLTMQPALELIRIFAQENAAALTASTFYWGTGLLSGILDNAPTYVSFLSAAMGKFTLNVNSVEDVRLFAAVHEADPQSWFYLQAISVAAVFFGALTYIGNGPNFMVKAIAESAGADTPSFGGYLVKYALPILIPVYFIIWVIFYSGWVLQLVQHG